MFISGFQNCGAARPSGMKNIMPVNVESPRNGSHDQKTMQKEIIKERMSLR